MRARPCRGGRGRSTRRPGVRPPATAPASANPRTTGRPRARAGRTRAAASRRRHRRRSPRYARHGGRGAPAARRAPTAKPGSKAKEANATGPVPGSASGSSTSRPARTPDHQRSAAVKRSGPVSSTRAASPHPTSPSPPRTQASAPSAGSRPIKSDASVDPPRRRRRRRRACGPGGARPLRLWTQLVSVRPLPAGGSGSARRCHLGSRHGRRRRCSHQRGRAVTRARLDREPAEVASMFDGVAERYDLTNDVLALGQNRRWRRAVVAAVGAAARPAGARPRGRHRDVQRAVRRRGRDVVACDFSLGMLAVGRRRRPDLDFVAGDAHPAALRATRAFDAVTISFGLRNVADPSTAPARDAAGHPARRPAGRLRVQPPDVARRSAPCTPSTSMRALPAVAAESLQPGRLRLPRRVDPRLAGPGGARRRRRRRRLDRRRVAQPHRRDRRPAPRDPSSPGGPVRRPAAGRTWPP